METVFERFPTLGKDILDSLSNEGLVQCRKTSPIWKNFIDEEKTIWIRMIEKHVGKVNLHPDWKKSLSKISTDTARELASAVCLFYTSKQCEHEDISQRSQEKWSPLHIVAECGNLHLFKIIFEKMDDKNPKNYAGNTPLHFAAT